MNTNIILRFNISNSKISYHEKQINVQQLQCCFSLEIGLKLAMFQGSLCQNWQTLSLCLFSFSIFPSPANDSITIGLRFAGDKLKI